jgi:hypothetical protein
MYPGGNRPGHGGRLSAGTTLFIYSGAACYLVRSLMVAVYAAAPAGATWLPIAWLLNVQRVVGGY